MSLIVLFYSKTINILNKKALIKKRFISARKSQPQLENSFEPTKCFPNINGTKRKQIKHNSVEEIELHQLKPSETTKKENLTRKQLKMYHLSLKINESTSTTTESRRYMSISHPFPLIESKSKCFHNSDSVLFQKRKFKTTKSKSSLDLSNLNNQAQMRKINLDYIEIIKAEKITFLDKADNEKSSFFGCLFAQKDKQENRITYRYSSVYCFDFIKL